VALPSLLSAGLDKEYGKMKTSHSHDDSWFETNDTRIYDGKTGLMSIF